MGVWYTLPMQCPHCYRYNRNPVSLDFTIDYFHMLDALLDLIATRDEIVRDTGQYPTETSEFVPYDELHRKLDEIHENRRPLVSLFSHNFVETICPPGVDPSATWFYKEVAEAKTNPANLYSGKVLAFVRATQELIQFFDRVHIKDTVRVYRTLGTIRREVESLLDDIHASGLQLSPQELTSLSNLERFGGSTHLLNSNLTLHELNDWIRSIRPDEPYAFSVFILQSQLTDPMTAQIKGQEFMELLLELSQAINPFDTELAANEMLTGWKYLHTPPPAP